MLFKTVALAATTLSGAFAAPALNARQSTQWTIRGLAINCASDGSSCTYNFGIDVLDGSTPAACQITNTVANAPQASWYDQVCSQDQPDWHVSWGFSASASPQFAVMTVVNTASNTEAFFGYTTDGNTGNYGDNGPQTTQPVS